MRARLLSIPVAVAALALGAAPASLARSTVTIEPKFLSVLSAQPAAVTAVAARRDKLRSCQVGDGRRAHKKAAGRAGETQRRAATVACEQPPRSTPNLTGLSNAETGAIIAAG